MITTRNRAILTLGLAAFGCAAPAAAPPPSPEPEPAPAPAAAPVEPVRAPVPSVNPALPPVPHVTGPLAIKVIYPPANQLITSKDSNFVFGSVGNGDAGLRINGVLTPVWPNGSFMAWLANPPADNPVYEIVARTGTDSASISHPVKINVPVTTPPAPPSPPAAPDTVRPGIRWAELIGPATYQSDTDRVVTGYALAGGIQRWFLIPKTVVKVVGTRGNDALVRLDTTKTIRIAQTDLKMLDSLPVSPKSPVVKAFKVTGETEWTDISIPISARPAYLVEVGPSSLTVTLYGTKGPSNRQVSVKGPEGSYVTSVSSFSSGPQMQYIVTLAGPVYGYQPLWEEGKFTFRVRYPPAIDPNEPLKGLTIAVDPGHPPIGATGPTGLWEPEVTLPVGLKLRDLLQAKGVNVLMTRTTPDPVDLNLRPTMARRANAHALVSIHLNAVPDGVNPFRVRGTATYHYHLHSTALASGVQTGLVNHLNLPDNGVKRENFALVRPTWMPAILAEGAFIIMPDTEAALRTPEYQERYAQGLVDGLEAYFRSLASPRN